MSALEEKITKALARSQTATSDFDLNPDTVLPEGRKLRPAGVLVGIETFGAAPQVVLTKRSSALKHHPGQIAFPGGKVDAGDRDVTDAALREAWEEIALPRELPKILGHLYSRLKHAQRQAKWQRFSARHSRTSLMLNDIRCNPAVGAARGGITLRCHSVPITSGGRQRACCAVLLR